MSPVIRVRIDDMGKLSEMMQQLGRDWPDIMEDAFGKATISSGYLGDVWRRTPKSDRARYASTYRNVKTSIKERGEDNRPETWKMNLSSGWRKQMMKGVDGDEATSKRQRSIARIEEYGNERLANSLLPDGQRVSSFRIHRTAKNIMMTLSSSVPYALRMHETEKPAEGQYWTPGQRYGWSSGKTGNKFLEKPYIDHKEALAKEVVAKINRELAKRGLI